MTPGNEDASADDLQAYAALRAQLNLQYDLPFTRHWSAAADFLQVIVDHCLSHRPATILECGSGLTTLMLARCCQLNARGSIHSLENGAEFSQVSSRYLADYGLQEYATIRHAPLETTTLNGVEYQWYRRDGIPDGKIDMLVIDGPPGFIQRRSRYPALPLLFNRLSDDCTIFLDDAARDEEREIVELWQSTYPALDHEYLETERGCSVLKVHRDN